MMIFRWHFDEEFCGISADPKFLEITSEILRAHRMGNHLVIMDRQLATALQNLQLSQADRALLNRLGSEFTQTGRLCARAEAYIVVRNSMEEISNRIGNEYQISLGFIAKSKLLERSILLVENISSDGWLLQKVFECTTTHVQLGFSAMETMHGGGDDIANVLEEIIPRKRIVVAFVDSDKNTPLSMACHKITRLKKSFISSNWPFGKVLSPPCREIENLIPLELITQLPSGVNCATNELLWRICQAEDKIDSPVSERFINYFDFKNGISSNSLSGLTPEEKNWLLSKILLAKMDVNSFEMGGYGDRVTNQIKSDGKYIGLLRGGFKQHSWKARFLNFFTENIWFFLANRPVRT